MARDRPTLDALALGLTPGHRATLLLDGREAYPAMLRAIDAAERSILLETYILRDDATGRTFARAIAARARRGVQAFVLYDAVGSLGLLSDTYLAFLRDAGVRVAAYHASLWRPWQWNQRDHRKILVVDGVTGFLGGLNIGDEYTPREQGGGGWRDTHLRLEGPETATLTRLFGQVFRRVTKTTPGPCEAAAPGALEAGSARAKVLGTSRHAERATLRRSWLDAISAAERRIWITTAYFLPTFGLRRALVGAARRGVDVRVITAGLSDVRAVQLAGRALYPALLRGGVRLYERLERVLHAKTVVVDGRFVAIGSYNLNHRSILHDLEVLAQLHDPGLGAALERAFEHDLDESVSVTRASIRARPLTERLLGWWLLRAAWFM